MTRMFSVRQIEHTADVGIEVEADSLEELFEGAAVGMSCLMLDIGKVRGVEEREVSIHASDLAEMMFKWLNELLFLFETEEFLFHGFDVCRIEGENLEAKITGENYDPNRHEILDEIKAATYHMMEVSKKNGKWFARVIFDV